MWIIENGVQMHPRRPFYYRLVLMLEMDSNLYGLGLQLGLDALA
jgi:hypothetical protein